MTELTHDEVRDLLAPYVLGAVDDEERAIVRAHILSCEECMRAADEYAAVTSFLDDGVDPAPLPTGFEDRVMTVAAGPDREVVAPVVPLRRKRWELLAVAASLVAMAVLAVSLLQARSDLDFERDVVSALVREEGMDLHGPSGAVGKMVPTSDGGIFVVAGLDDAPAEHDYQVWVIRGDDPSSAGVFEVENGVTAVDIEESLEGADAVAVTIEPDGGSPEPTSDPVLSTS